MSRDALRSALVVIALAALAGGLVPHGPALGVAIAAGVIGTAVALRYPRSIIVGLAVGPVLLSSYVVATPDLTSVLKGLAIALAVFGVFGFGANWRFLLPLAAYWLILALGLLYGDPPAAYSVATGV